MSGVFDEAAKMKEEADKLLGKKKEAPEATAPSSAPASAPKKKSEVAARFSDPNSKTWADVQKENDNDPEKIAGWLNTNTSYKPGEKTKAGMKEYGYSQGEDGKWALASSTPEATPETDNTISAIEDIADKDKNVENEVNGMLDDDGNINKKKAETSIENYERHLVELGAATYDKNGNFVLTPVQKQKGWETWATLLSVGLSVVGIAMGIPIIPINFKAVTGKGSNEKQLQDLQEQYMTVKSNTADKVGQMTADIEAGEIAQENQDALAAQERHANATAAQSALIDKQTEAEMKKVRQQLQHNEKILGLEMKHAKEMAQLQSVLNTASAKELAYYGKAGWVIEFIKECQAQGMNEKDIALAIASINGITPTQMALKNAESVVDMGKKTIDAFKPKLIGN